MAIIAEYIPDEKTLYFVMQAGWYRCHNGFEGGLLVSNIERALMQKDYKFIDCFPTHGGESSLTLEQYGDIWETLEGH